MALAATALLPPLLLLLTVLAWSRLPGPRQGTMALLDRSDTGSAGLPQQLADLGLVQSRWLMWLYVHVFCSSAETEPGRHLLRVGDSPRQIMVRLARLRARPVVRVTVPEGWNSRQIADRMQTLEICPMSEFLLAARSKPLLSEVRLGGPSAEGYLFPATYEFRVNSPAEQVVRTLVREAHAKFEAITHRHAGAARQLEMELGWGTQQIVILASIIEKEAARPAEKRMIAGVFFNRLRDPSFRPARRLQSDPTAAYGCIVAPDSAPSCAGYQGRVTPAMLRDESNEYNTYLHPGLPPGPIANPGESALEAVLAPEQTDNLFFVAESQGRHRFSRTLEQHNAAVRASRRSAQGTGTPSDSGRP